MAKIIKQKQSSLHRTRRVHPDAKKRALLPANQFLMQLLSIVKHKGGLFHE